MGSVAGPRPRVQEQAHHIHPPAARSFSVLFGKLHEPGDACPLTGRDSAMLFVDMGWRRDGGGVLTCFSGSNH